jgi:hypothetical protein
MLLDGVRRRQTLVACTEDARAKRANGNNERRKEAGFVGDLSAARRLGNERGANEEGSRPDVSVEKRRGR